MPLPLIPREKIPWFPSLREEACSGCRACLDFCPNGVFVWDEAGRTARVGRPFACVVGCSNCLAVCPAGAISFPGLDEIAGIIGALRRDSGLRE